MGKDIVSLYFQITLNFMLQPAFTGAIHRFECRRDGTYKAADKEKVLSGGNVLSITNAATLSCCAKQCTSHTQCRSFNFKKRGSKNCQILDINKRNSSGKIENAPGWIHYDPVTTVCNQIILKLIESSSFFPPIIYNFDHYCLTLI